MGGARAVPPGAPLKAPALLRSHTPRPPPLRTEPVVSPPRRPGHPHLPPPPPLAASPPAPLPPRREPPERKDRGSALPACRQPRLGPSIGAAGGRGPRYLREAGARRGVSERAAGADCAYLAARCAAASFPAPHTASPPITAPLPHGQRTARDVKRRHGNGEGASTSPRLPRLTALRAEASPSPGPPRPRPRERASPIPRRPPPLPPPRVRAPPLSPGRRHSASAGRAARPGAVPGAAARVWAFPPPLRAPRFLPSLCRLCVSHPARALQKSRSRNALAAALPCPERRGRSRRAGLPWGLRRADAEGEEEGCWNAERCPCWKRFFIFYRGAGSPRSLGCFVLSAVPSAHTAFPRGCGTSRAAHTASSNAALRPRLGEVAVQGAARGARPAGRGAAGRASPSAGVGEVSP